MRQKFSTILDRALYRKLKLESARQGKSISEMVSDALEAYLQPSKPSPIGRVVDGSWGAFSLDRETVKKLLRDEESLLDS